MVQCNLTQTEMEILACWRKQVSRLVHVPDGWVFSVDANPDRMVSTFQDKERLDVKRARPGGGGNGHGGNNGNGG